MATPVPWIPRGVLNAGTLVQEAPVGRFLPAPPLAPFVEHFWAVAWDLRGRAPQTRETLPHPSVHLVVEAGRSRVVGVHTSRFARILEGQGRVLGIKFRPGGFYPFRPLPLSDLTDQALTLDEALGPGSGALETAILACGDDTGAAVTAAEAFLLARLPARDPQAEAAGGLVARIREDRGLLRAEALAASAGISLRVLQRRFGEYIGVGPKWVIHRYRMHEALAQLEAGSAPDLAGLALDLGFHDQAHFNRAFKALVGRSPAAYARAPHS